MNIFTKSTLALALVVSLSLPFAALAENASTTEASRMHLGSGRWKKSAEPVKTGTASSVTGSSIALAGSDGVTYTVDATNAKIIRRYGAAMLVSDIQTGDKLAVTGTVTGSSIAATSIRDQSLQAKNGTFSGTVTAVNGSSFTISTGRGSQTVNTTSATVYKKNGQTDTNGISDVVTGARVRVSGVWDSNSSTVAAASVNVIVRLVGISVTGTLSAVSGTTLTVMGGDSVSYTVDASSTRVLYKGGRRADLGILQTGDQVQVRGRHVSGSSSVAAASVRDLSRSYQKPAAQ